MSIRGSLLSGAPGSLRRGTGPEVGNLPWDTRSNVRSSGSEYPEIDGLTGTVYHWIADAGLSLSGTDVLSWTDRKQGKVVTRKGTGNEPTYIASDTGFGGAPCLDFNTPSSDGLSTAAPDDDFKFLHDGSGATLLLDFLPDAALTENGLILDTSGGGGKNGLFVRATAADGTIRVYLTNNSATPEYDGSGSVDTRATRARVALRLSAGFAGNDVSMRVNAVSDLTAASYTAATSLTPTQPLTFGSRTTSSTTDLDGKIREVVLVNRYLSDAEVQAWEAARGL